MWCIKRSAGFGILLEKPGIELPPFWLVDDPLYTYTGFLSELFIWIWARMSESGLAHRTWVCVHCLVCIPPGKDACLSLFPCMYMATADMSKAGLRASSFWLDSSLCCSWEMQQHREKRGKKRTNHPSSSTPIIFSVSQCYTLQLSLCFFLFFFSSSLHCIPVFFFFTIPS